MKKKLIIGGLMVSMSFAAAVPLGNLGNGVTAQEGASGQGYILFAPDGVGGERPVHEGASTHFIAVYFEDEKWFYYENEVPNEFSPAIGDTLVAEVDYSLDTVTMLNGWRGSVSGVSYGYVGGDLVITPNQYAGEGNAGEFGLSGTNITLNPEPVWWFEKSVIDPTVTDPNHRAMVNLGQAKWMVRNALELIEEGHPGLAYYIKNGLVGVSDSHPFSEWPPASSGEADKAVLQTGQLKAISAPFYHGLNQLAPDWLETEMNFVETRQVGTHFPWGSAIGDENNHAPANLGQLKALFSMRLIYLPDDLELDTDGDGLTDIWEVANGYNPYLRDTGVDGVFNGVWDGDEDFDGDGLSNLYELNNNLDPLKASTHGTGEEDGEGDFDLDGRIDNEEATYEGPFGPSIPGITDNPKVMLNVTVLP